jgi:hypothetical protein
MAAGLGFKTFATGDVLTAADANGYLASQVVMVFASAAARTSAIASPQEGMISYLKDTDVTQYYSGSAWVSIGGSTSKVIQMVNTQTGTVATGTGNIPSDNSIPQITEGDQYMTLSITPTSASSVLLIDVFAISAAGSDTFQSAALFQDSTANALASIAGLIAGTDKVYTFAFRHKMTAGTTSATTFRVRIGGNAGTTTFNGRAAGQLLGGSLASSITITEYTP